MAAQELHRQVASCTRLSPRPSTSAPGRPREGTVIDAPAICARGMARSRCASLSPGETCMDNSSAPQSLSIRSRVKKAIRRIPNLKLPSGGWAVNTINAIVLIGVASFLKCPCYGEPAKQPRPSRTSGMGNSPGICIGLAHPRGWPQTPSFISVRRTARTAIPNVFRNTPAVGLGGTKSAGVDCGRQQRDSTWSWDSMIFEDFAKDPLSLSGFMLLR